MEPVRPVWLDGSLVGWGEARTSALSHAMQRGSLVFDVAALRPTMGGGAAVFRAREHIERFLRSAATIGLDVAWDADTLLAATLETAGASRLSSALVRWSAFVSTIEADVLPGAGARTSTAIAVVTRDDGLPPGETAPPRRAATRVEISRETRKAGPEVLPPQAKVAAAYLGPMLAKRRAIARGHDEVVLLDRDGNVAEAPTSNVFAVKNGMLMTPPTDHALAGITRASVLELARAEGMPASEAPLTPEDLTTADEAFLAGTSLPVQPISTVDGRPLRDAVPGPVTARVLALLLACERGQDARFGHWLSHVVRR
jgi:branched-chain amino acid aminotransferase